MQYSINNMVFCLDHFSKLTGEKHSVQIKNVQHKKTKKSFKNVGPLLPCPSPPALTSPQTSIFL